MFGPVTLAVHAVPVIVHGRAMFLVPVLLVDTIVMAGRDTMADSAVGHKFSRISIYNINIYTVNHMLEILVDIFVVFVLLEDIFFLPE